MRTRTRREQRVLSAHKIKHRKKVTRECWWLNCYANQPSGRFSERLLYSSWTKRKSPWKSEPTLADRKKLESLNHRMEEYYNEGLCELS